MTNLEIRTLPLEQLVPAPYNPRKPISLTDPAYQKLRRSLEVFGLVEPLIWNETTGHVVGGHLRLRILQELGLTEVPVSVVRLRPAQEKSLNIVLNNHEAQGRYDRLKLAELLSELRELPELELTGFDASTLRKLEFSPTPEVLEKPQEQIEIMVRLSPDQFEDVEDAFNALIQQFHLEVHVRRV